MHGLGNDFVIVDARKVPFAPTPVQAKRIADRHFGVGCDQLIVLEPPQDAAARPLAFGGWKPWSVLLVVLAALGALPFAAPHIGGEAVLVTDIDLGEIPRALFDLDVVGHYARPDIFQLRVNESQQLPVVIDAHGDPEEV